MRIGIFLISCLLVSAGCSRPAQEAAAAAADRVFLNGAVYTVDAERSWAEAVAITDGRIVYVGDDEVAASYIGPETEVIDLVGQMLLPGFHDSHIHILTEMMTDEECDLLRIEPVEEVAAKLKACTELAGHGEHRWITGGGWSMSVFGPGGRPSKTIIDEPPPVIHSTSGLAAAYSPITAR